MTPKTVLTAVLAAATVAATFAAQRAPAPANPNVEWRAYGGDLRHQHYSSLAQIDASNFNGLEVAWRFKTDSLGPRPEFKLEGTPLEVTGTLYTPPAPPPARAPRVSPPTRRLASCAGSTRSTKARARRRRRGSSPDVVLRIGPMG